MLNPTRLRSAAALLSSVLAGFVLHAASPAAAQTGPGLEELGLSSTSGSPALPRQVLELAGAYRMYMQSAADLSADFADGQAVADSLRQGVAYEPKQLARGAVAYAAVSALQDRSFTAAVQAAGADPARRKALASDLLADPRAAFELDRTGSASSLVAAALTIEGEAVRDAGRRVKQSAYDVQRMSWSKIEVTDRVGRLAEAKSLSARPLQPSEAQLSRLISLERPPISTRLLQSDRPVVARGLALAALALLGEIEAEAIEPLLLDAGCASCLRMAKLNLFQCLAVAKPWYEDVFCLGQHVLIDTGECIQAAALPRPPLMAVARREDD